MEVNEWVGFWMMICIIVTLCIITGAVWHRLGYDAGIKSVTCKENKKVK